MHCLSGRECCARVYGKCIVCRAVSAVLESTGSAFLSGRECCVRVYGKCIVCRAVSAVLESTGSALFVGP